MSAEKNAEREKQLLRREGYAAALVGSVHPKLAAEWAASTFPLVPFPRVFIDRRGTGWRVIDGQLERKYGYPLFDKDTLGVNGGWAKAEWMTGAMGFQIFFDDIASIQDLFARPLVEDDGSLLRDGGL